MVKMLFSLCVVLLMVLLALRAQRSSAKILFVIFATLIFTLGIIDAVCNALSGSSFNDAIWFHLRFGIKGAGIEEFATLAIRYLVIAWVGFFAIWFPLRQKSIKKMPILKKLDDRKIVLAGSIFFVIAVIFHPFSQAVWEVTARKKISGPTADFYVNPEIQFNSVTHKNRPPNLVWIYAESLERTYLDESLFPELTPGLKALERDSASFTNVEQVGATGWTIAGMVASQCGMPLVSTGGSGNSMSGVKSFLPGVKCFGDLLKEQNYNLTYMGGADLDFAGKGQFYRTHSFDEVLGRAQLQDRLVEKSYVSGWGLYDDSLFEFVREKYQTLLHIDKQPFALVTLTLDTHHPAGHISKPCQGTKYRDGKNPILNAVHCSDFLISNLIKDIRRLDRDNNTVIVVSSDHLAMPNTASDDLNSRNRRNLFVINWPGRVAPEKIDRPAATFSSGATILGVMGFKMKGLGLGRDLFGKDLTVIETYKDYDSVISSWTPLFLKAWQLPQAVKEITVLPNYRKVIVGPRSYSLPVLMSFNEKNDITGLVFPEAGDSQTLVARAFESNSNDTRILVEDCLQLKSKVSDSEVPESGLCWWNSANRQAFVIKKRTSFAL